MKKLSPLQIERLKYQPKLPQSLQNGVNGLRMVEGSATQSVRDQEQINALLEVVRRFEMVKSQSKNFNKSIRQVLKQGIF